MRKKGSLVPGIQNKGFSLFQGFRSVMHAQVMSAELCFQALFAFLPTLAVPGG
jgi:hypothetical protein